MEFNLQLYKILEIALALLLGGIVGLEREFARKSAGLRTHMLVAGVSAFLVGLGDAFVFKFANWNLNEFFRADPYRIMGAIITGLSFIGAGAIIQKKSEEQVEGLTTAASLLFTAVIGMAVGLEQFYLAIGATVLILFVNVIVKFFENLLRKYFVKNNFDKKNNSQN